MGARHINTSAKARARIMHLYEQKLSYSVIAQRTGFTPRTISRTVKKELAARAKLQADGQGQQETVEA